jgi:hypothetical protein
MLWIVTIEIDDEDAGNRATVEVFATNKDDAAYRAAHKIERELKVRTGRLIAARRR